MKKQITMIMRLNKKSLLAGTALSFAAMFGTVFGSLSPSYAQTLQQCEDTNCSPEANVIEVGANTEQNDDAIAIEGVGFSISVDGEPVASSKKASHSPTKVKAPTTRADRQRQADLILEEVDIQVKFDGLDVKPVLNVTTSDLRHSYNAGEVIEFTATSNYPDWINRSEILIFERGRERVGKPITVLPVDGNLAHWQMPDSEGVNGGGDFSYVLRVYDDKGRYDETVPLGVSRTSTDFAKHETSPDEEAIFPGEGEDRTSVRNIPVYGGAVTVFGRNVPPGYSVNTLGESVAIDNENAFVIQRILPPGDHVVDVNVSGTKDGGLAFDREITIPENDWFYVGLADITYKHKLSKDTLFETSPGEFDDHITKGRLAFYLKGKIKGEYILTAAADTGHEQLENLFNNLDEKDPRQLLRRIDPDDYYPIYGDDSTIYEDAPTQGKFYIRLEKGQSHALWGNFKTQITGTEFARVERGFYGAQAVLKSDAVTSHGEPVAQIEAYAAQPETLPQRDILRGTGGSVYFLTRQDITRGSETITIEVRDPVSGIVRSRQTLRYGEDYDIDYIQGVIILTRPLNSTANGTSLVTEGALGDDDVNLVAQYEFTPTLSDVDGLSYGGRGQVWLSDNVQVGASGIREDTGVADQTLVEADVTLKLGKNSYIRGEVAESSGPGFGRSNSLNGGLTIVDTATSGVQNRDARAYRAEAHIDLSDIDPNAEGSIGAYYEKREEGFSSLDYETNVDQEVWGVFIDRKVNDYLEYKIGYESFEDALGRVNRELDAQLSYRFASDWTVALGAKHTELRSAIGDVNSAQIGQQNILENGRRTDIAAKITHTVDDDQTYYAFGQATVSRNGNIDRNDRVGIGAEVRISEKVALNGEVSYGTNGWGGRAGLTYDPTADDHFYIGYELDQSRQRSAFTPLNGNDLGSIVVGRKHRYNDTFSAYLENSYDLYGQTRSLTSTYGVTYTPNALWSYDFGVEYGDVEDSTFITLERLAVSASVGYTKDDLINFRLKGEVRFEDSNNIGLDRDTYLFSGFYSHKQNEDWRFLANIDAVVSQSNQADFLDGDYIEASIGYAYRPVDNDKLNALFKYNYLFDLPGPDQITVTGNDLGPAQRSHILSADFIYDINQTWSIGAKYGFRFGEVSATRSADNFTKSSAHLGVLRLDWHIVNNWDLLLEGRVLHTPEISTTDFGFVAAGYRHINDNFKVGVGYNFANFSDDLTDLTRDDEGVFVNLVGKF